MNEQPFDPIADLRMAVEQIKREPKPQPDMVPWDEYQPRIMLIKAAQPKQKKEGK